MLRDRVARAVIGPRGGQGVELAALRMAFTVEKSVKREANKTRLAIWNMSDSTRAAIKELDDYLLLYAGYAQESGALLLAAGDVSRVNHAHEAPDWKTYLQTGDGLLELREVRVSLAFDEGATCGQIIRKIAESLALPTRSLPAIEPVPYVSGFSFIGRAADALDKVTERAGLEWSIQKGELQLLQKNQPALTEVQLIAPGTGMIGSPELLTETGGDLSKTALKRGYKVSSYLNAKLEPGAPVQIESRQHSALCRIEKLIHSGDTGGNQWRTDMELREIDE